MDIETAKTLVTEQQVVKHLPALPHTLRHRPQYPVLCPSSSYFTSKTLLHKGAKNPEKSLLFQEKGAG